MLPFRHLSPQLLIVYCTSEFADGNGPSLELADVDFGLFLGEMSVSVVSGVGFECRSAGDVVV